MSIADTVDGRSKLPPNLHMRADSHGLPLPTLSFDVADASCIRSLGAPVPSTDVRTPSPYAAPFSSTVSALPASITSESNHATAWPDLRHESASASSTLGRLKSAQKTW